MEAKPQLAGCFYQRLENAFPAVRENVVVIGRQGAAAQEEARHRGAGGHAHDVGVDARPHRVKRAQPLEQGPVWRVATSGTLVNVGVSVDQARHRDAVGRIDDLVRQRRVPGTPLCDYAVAGENPATLDLAVPGEQETGADEQRGGHESTMSCGRTGTRERLRPLAARIAPTIAGPGWMVVGAPTPLTPESAFECPSPPMAMPT